MCKNWGALLMGLTLIGCQFSTSKKQDQPNQQQTHYNSRVIYGEDNRLDIHEILDPAWLAIASSTVALVDKTKISKTLTGYDIATRHFGTTYRLCSDEPFFEQSAAAFCSGALIGADTVVTAGHCLESQEDCLNTKFVFDFGYLSPSHDPSHVDNDDVYGCRLLIHSEVDGFRGSDFAIVKLDRPVVARTPLVVRESGMISVADEILVIGHPSGLPTKLADGASVRENGEPDFFVANLDSYGGNSGSAVFNIASKEVEGILVRGETDYIFQNGCRRSNICPESGCRGEDVTRITNIFDHISPEDLKDLKQD